MTPNPLAYEDPNDTIERGRRQLQVLWRRCSRQRGMTQPKWIKLSAAIFPGPQHLHSSQIGGLATGRMRDPSPKCLLVLGQLNASIAASARNADGSRKYPDVVAPEFPDHLRDIWEHLEPMLDRYGHPLGPQELFLVSTGLVDLGLDNTRTISPADEAAASATLGRHLRLGLAALGRDFLSELPQLRAECPSMEPLLMGQTVPGDTLVADLPTLAATLRTTEDDLWSLVTETLTPDAAA